MYEKGASASFSVCGTVFLGRPYLYMILADCAQKLPQSRVEANHRIVNLCYNRLLNSVIRAEVANGWKVRRAAVHSLRMLRNIANVRFGEAAARRSDTWPMAAMGR
jgi:hypothetical protein